MDVRRCCALFLVLSAGTTDAAVAGPVEVRVRPTSNVGLELLQQGRIDEACRELGFGPFPGDKLLRLAREARAAGRRTDALGFFEAYLYYFPFDCPGPDLTSDQWSGAAVEYVRLLSATEAPDEQWLLQSRAALSAYQALCTTYRRADAQRCIELAERIITRYPHSIFCESAVLIAAKAAGGSRTHGGRDVYRTLLGRMGAAGIPERNRLFVIRAHMHSSSLEGREPVERLDLSDMLRLSDNPLFRRGYLRNEARVALKAKKLDAARDLLAKFVQQFPDDFQSKAHLQVVEAYLEEEHPDAALAWVRDRQKRHPGVDVSVELFRIADHLRSKGRPEEAIVCYREVIESFADSPHVPPATLRIALAYKSLGKEELMVAALRDLVDKPPMDSRAAIMDARNSAHEELATYYMSTKNWAEALRSWQSWEPSTFCGFGYAARVEKKQQSIEYCINQLAAQH